MPDTRDLYWLAGLLEGEGYFGFVGPRRPDGTIVGGSCRITLGMTDHDVMQRARDVMAYGPLLHRKKPSALSKKPQWQFTVDGRRAAGWMMTLYPLLGARRQQRIRESLDLWRRQRAQARPTNLCGHAERPHGARRMCRTCYGNWKAGHLRLDLHPGLIGTVPDRRAGEH